MATHNSCTYNLAPAFLLDLVHPDLWAAEGWCLAGLGLPNGPRAALRVVRPRACAETSRKRNSLRLVLVVGVFCKERYPLDGCLEGKPELNHQS